MKNVIILDYNNNNICSFTYIIIVVTSKNSLGLDDYYFYY